MKNACESTVSITESVIFHVIDRTRSESRSVCVTGCVKSKSTVDTGKEIGKRVDRILELVTCTRFAIA